MSDTLPTLIRLHRSGHGLTRGQYSQIIDRLLEFKEETDEVVSCARMAFWLGGIDGRGALAKAVKELEAAENASFKKALDRAGWNE